MRLSFLVLCFCVPAFSGSAYYASGGPGRCLKFASYEALKVKLSKTVGRKCIENPKTKEFTCSGSGIEPSTYTYYSSDLSCARRKQAAERKEDSQPSEESED